MALKDTIKHLRDLLNHITHDLQKAENGNKAASQRVRTGTVKLEKVAKTYRKESIKGEKGATKRPAAKKAAHKKATSKKAAPKKAHAHAPSHAKKAAVKSKPKAKAHRAHPRAMSFKRPSAKLPAKKHASK